MSATNLGKIALVMMQIRDQLKIYHWQTTSYAQHIASDSLVNSLTTSMDKFMETIQGKYNKRLQIPAVLNIEINNGKNITDLLSMFCKWLENDLPMLLDKSKNNTDLLNIRDEILGNVNQTLYLLSLN